MSAIDLTAEIRAEQARESPPIPRAEDGHEQAPVCPESPPKATILSVTGLRKSFRVRKGREPITIEAVRGVDLRVAEGEIFGFLGPNGAGKTTLLRMLATLIVPDDGEGSVAGADLLSDPEEVRRYIGYVAQGGGTWDNVTAREELVLQARMYGIGKSEAQRRAAVALEVFDLTDYADRKCRTYSGGQRRRVDVALGVIHEPKVLFLDEPTTGLDPQNRARMWEEIRRLRAQGMTIFLTTHYLDEADALCDRVAIIDHGRIVTEGSPSALKQTVSGDVVTVAIRRPPAGEKECRDRKLEGAAEALRSESCVVDLEVDAEGLRLHVDTGATAILRIMRALDGAQVPIDSIQVHRPSLDDVFLAETGRSLRDK